jgi:uncharacterized membrane protein
VAIMPPHYTHPVGLVQISGVAEVLGGVGLLVPWSRRFAAWGIVVMLVVYFDVHIYMALHASRFANIPAWVIYARLPLQVLLIAWAGMYALRPCGADARGSHGACGDEVGQPCFLVGGSPVGQCVSCGLAGEGKVECEETGIDAGSAYPACEIVSHGAEDEWREEHCEVECLLPARHGGCAHGVSQQMGHQPEVGQGNAECENEQLPHAGCVEAMDQFLLLREGGGHHVIHLALDTDVRASQALLQDGVGRDFQLAKMNDAYECCSNDSHMRECCGPWQATSACEVQQDGCDERIEHEGECLMCHEAEAA